MDISRKLDCMLSAVPFDQTTWAVQKFCGIMPCSYCQLSVVNNPGSYAVCYAWCIWVDSTLVCRVGRGF